MTVAETRHLKFLLIDDEPFIRLTIRQILVQIGFPQANVYEADSATTGMTETLRVRPHVILCDIHMPVADGFVFLSNLSKSPISGISDIPVIMLTSDATEEAVLTAKGHKVSGYLVKPVSINAVKKALERALKVTL